MVNLQSKNEKISVLPRKKFGETDPRLKVKASSSACVLPL
jgi:hypothetical protein